MLLTTLALVKRKVGRLPNRRVDLYYEAVRVLLNWRSEVDKPLDYREAEPQLHYLAYAMCERGVQQLREDEIIELAHHHAPRVSQCPLRLKTALPTNFYASWSAAQVFWSKSVIFATTGKPKPVYEFRHLTFQEYLAGLALVKGYFPNRDKSRTLPDYVAPLAGRTSKRRGEVVVTEEWREPLRLCVAACNDDDVDNVLNAILSPLPNEDTTTTTRPRAVLAALCLADEPNVSQKMADRILQTFSNQVHAMRGPSEFRDAAIELASSRWKENLWHCLVKEFCDRDPSERDSVGNLCKIVINATISDNEEAARTWLAEQITYLASDIEVKAIESALGIVGLANIWIYNTRKAPKSVMAMLRAKAPELLMAMLHANGPKAHAAARGLATLHNRSSMAWRPLQSERETMIAVVNNPATDTGVVRWLASILGRERDSEAVEPLIARLDGPDVSVCIAVAEALGEIGDVQAVEPLSARLNNPNESVREVVAVALGKIGDVQAIKPLSARLNDSQLWVRTAVAKALREIGDPQAVEFLITSLNDRHQLVREVVVMALGEIGDAQAVKHLIPYLGDLEAQVRESVAWALGNIGDPQAIEALIDCLDDSDKWVRKVVAEALGKLGEQAVKALITRLHDREA